MSELSLSVIIFSLKRTHTVRKTAEINISGVITDICHTVCLSHSVFAITYVCRAVCHSICTVYLSVVPSVCPSDSQSVVPSTLSVNLSVALSVCVSCRLPINLHSLSCCLSVHLSVSLYSFRRNKFSFKKRFNSN
jgi:hypothetical protein